LEKDIFIDGSPIKALGEDAGGVFGSTVDEAIGDKEFEKQSGILFFFNAIALALLRQTCVFRGAL